MQKALDTLTQTSGFDSHPDWRRRISYMSKLRPAEIRCDESGFAVALGGSVSSEGAASLKWNEVKTVLAYKRDLYATDLICLGFTSPAGTIEVDEEMHGWTQLVERLPSFLPGTPPMPDWWERVAKPPFAACVTKLFERT